MVLFWFKISSVLQVAVTKFLECEVVAVDLRAHGESQWWVSYCSTEDVLVLTCSYTC